MKIFTKILLLASYTPIIVFVTIQALGSIFAGVSSFMFAGLLPLLGMFSGFSGAQGVFSEFAVILFLSALLISVSALSLYFLYKIILSIWKDIITPSYKLIVYTLIIIVLALTAIGLAEPVSEFYGALHNSSETADYTESASTASDWVLLVYIVPYSLLILLYVHFRDKSLSSSK